MRKKFYNLSKNERVVPWFKPKIMKIGKAHSGKVFVDYLGKQPERANIDSEGNTACEAIFRI